MYILDWQQRKGWLFGGPTRFDTLEIEIKDRISVFVRIARKEPEGVLVWYSIRTEPEAQGKLYTGKFRADVDKLVRRMVKRYEDLPFLLSADDSNSGDENMG